jgi:hypothetical protein
MGSACAIHIFSQTVCCECKTIENKQREGIGGARLWFNSILVS